jgi:hypothetical protein
MDHLDNAEILLEWESSSVLSTILLDAQGPAFEPGLAGLIPDARYVPLL